MFPFAARSPNIHPCKRQMGMLYYTGHLEPYGVIPSKGWIAPLGGILIWWTRELRVGSL